MTQKIYYEDNIFYVRTLIRNVSDALKLNIEPDYFSEKLLEDLIFIDTAIQKIYTLLQENKHLIKRNAYFHSVSKLKKSFSLLVDEVLALEGPLPDRMSRVFPKLRRSVVIHLQDVKEIRKKFQELNGPKLESDLISYDELNILMDPLEEEDKELRV